MLLLMKLPIIGAVILLDHEIKRYAKQVHCNPNLGGVEFFH